MREIDKAIELLTPLFEGAAKDRESTTVSLRSEIIHGSDYVVATINGHEYKVNVECENVRAIITDVVDACMMKL